MWKQEKSSSSWSSPGERTQNVSLWLLLNPFLTLFARSHFNIAEILAMAELGCQHVTIQASNLQRLMETSDTFPPVTRIKPKHPYAEFAIPERLKTLVTLDPLAGPEWDGHLATTHADFLANGGEKLDTFIKENVVLNKRFTDAVTFFLGAEEGAKATIEELIASKGPET